MHEDKLMKAAEWLSNAINDPFVKATIKDLYDRVKLQDDHWQQLKETVQEICDNNKENEERMLVANFILNLMNVLEKEHE